jgi:hypothetical protein
MTWSLAHTGNVADEASDAPDPSVSRRRNAVAGRRYEFRIIGRLSPRARAAFRGMEVREVPAETVLRGDVTEAGGVQEVLTLIQSLGLEVVSVRRTSGDRYADERTSRPDT